MVSQVPHPPVQGLFEIVFCLRKCFVRECFLFEFPHRLCSNKFETTTSDGGW
jgi:hypothetical protein